MGSEDHRMSETVQTQSRGRQGDLGLPLREDKAYSLALEITGDSRGKEPNITMIGYQEVQEEGFLLASCSRMGSWAPRVFPGCKAPAPRRLLSPRGSSLVFAQASLLADSGAQGTAQTPEV